MMPGRNALAPAALDSAHPTLIRAPVGDLAGPSLDLACLRAPRSGGETPPASRRPSALVRPGRTPPGPLPVASDRTGNPGSRDQATHHQWSARAGHTGIGGRPSRGRERPVHASRTTAGSVGPSGLVITKIGNYKPVNSTG